MTNPFPLPRETRETAPFAGDGRATYGPFSFKIWDAADVAAEVLRLDGEWKLEAIVAQKIANQPIRRLHRDLQSASQDRRHRHHPGAPAARAQSDVTRGGAISGVALERELSTIGTVIQELRRDIDAKLAESLGGQGIVTIGDVVGLSGALAPRPA